MIALFRRVDDWLEAMRKEPLHAPAHINMERKEFVTKAWTMDQPQSGLGLDMEARVREMNALCQEQYAPGDVQPCFDIASFAHEGAEQTTAQLPALYEMRYDGSGLPYNNILELRSDKIRNLLSLRDAVDHFESLAYEQWMYQGTKSIIQRLEKVIGTPAQCNPLPPSNKTLEATHHNVDFADWLRKHVDWETEALAGYVHVKDDEHLIGYAASTTA